MATAASSETTTPEETTSVGSNISINICGISISVSKNSGRHIPHRKQKSRRWSFRTAVHGIVALALVAAVARNVLFEYGGGRSAFLLQLASAENLKALTARLSTDTPPVDPAVDWEAKGGGGSDGVEAAAECSMRFYIYSVPSVTDELVFVNATLPLEQRIVTDEAERYVDKPFINEDLGEIWLHRGFMRHKCRTDYPVEADAFLIPGYLHMNMHFNPYGDYGERKERFLAELRRGIDDAAARFEARDRPTGVAGNETFVPFFDRPHVVMCPMMRQLARKIGVKGAIQLLRDKRLTRVYSIGLERNNDWSGRTDVANVLMAPYVVRPHLPREEIVQIYSDDDDAAGGLKASGGGGNEGGGGVRIERRTDFVFYSATFRKYAIDWGGCDRRMVLPLKDEANAHVALDEKIPQSEFQKYMRESEYCLITCGDTPTSRRLADSMVMGCIPIFVGRRLFGRCDPPCKCGWGWTCETNGLFHLPYEREVPWENFPIVDEANFTANPKRTLDEAVFQNFHTPEKSKLRSIMGRMQLAFLYGWGSPLTSEEFGHAVPHLWHSLLGQMDHPKEEKLS